MIASPRIRVVALLDQLRPEGGGAERIATGVAAGLDPERFESTLCLTRWSEQAASAPGAAAALEALGDAGVRVIGLRRRHRFDLAAAAPLRAVLREGIEVLHGHMPASSFWAAALGRRHRIPVVIAHEQTWEFAGQPLRVLIDRHFIAPRVSAYVAVSEDDRRALIEREKIPAALTRVIANGIPALASPPDSAGLRSALGIDPAAPLLGAVGRLHHQKDFPLLVEAVGLLDAVAGAPRTPHLAPHLVIAGEGPARAEIEAAISARGLGPRVHLLGSRADVAAILAELDIAVLVSRFEGSPLALMEYMRAGRAIVATEVRGITQLIEHDVNGLLVAPRDPAALAAALTRLLADPELATRLGAAAAAHQAEHFSIAATTRRFESLYEELLGSRRGP